MPRLLSLLLYFLLILAISPSHAQSSVTSDFSSYQDEAQQIIDTALNDKEAFDRLTYFVDKFGHRFSGSESLENSIDWIVSEMRKQPFDDVRTQEVMVPHWVRGEESATLLAPRKKDLPMLGLGAVAIACPLNALTPTNTNLHEVQAGVLE